MVTLKSDNLTDLWAQRLTKLFGWNIRETNKPLEKRKHTDSIDSLLREDENMYNFEQLIERKNSGQSPTILLEKRTSR
jgi:hypothetical protein